MLRILSMLLIVMHHYSVHGGFNLNEQSLSLNKLWVQILSLGGKLGVNCFVLVSGYFLIKSKFKLKKIFIILGEVYFYSIGLFFIFVGLGISDFSLSGFIKSFLPITYSSYWFVTVYIFMYILSPDINSFIKSLSKENLFNFICISMFLWCIIPTFLVKSPEFSNLAWFITLYTIAAYCRLYPNKYILNCKFNICLSTLMYFMAIISVVIFNLIGVKLALVGENATYFMSGNKIPIALCSISLFLAFKNLNIQSNNFINTIAATTFGIYLIHDNIYVIPFLWENILKNSNYLYSKYLILHAIISILLVFIICSTIDYLRMKFIETPILKFIDKNTANFKKYEQYYISLIRNIISKFKVLFL
ncbi:acyltransferase family protein [Clostridium perfringens]